MKTFLSYVIPKESHVSHQISSKQYGEGHPFPRKQSSLDKPKVIDASHLFKQQHRLTRPDHFVIILRGLPGTKVCMYNMFCKHDDVTAENYRSSLAISLAFCVFDLWPYSRNHLMHLLSGSGKSYLAKMLRDLEVENGGDAPRIHSMDDYFMTEVEKVCCFFFFFSPSFTKMS